MLRIPKMEFVTRWSEYVNRWVPPKFELEKVVILRYFVVMPTRQVSNRIEYLSWDDPIHSQK